MAKEFCSSCEVRLAEPVAFCPACETPTRHATDSERLEWDLHQWRAHVDRSVAAGVPPASRVVERPVTPRPVAARPVSIREADSDLPKVVVRPKLVPSPPPSVGLRPRVEAAAARMAAAPVRKEPAQRPIAPAISPVPAKVAPSSEEPRARRRLPRVQRSGKKRPEPETIHLDADHEFVYRACAVCDRTDWLLRGTRNEDETWNYWCVRCSRSFKTDLKIPYAVKPFVAAAIPLGGILTASVLLLH